MSAMEDGTGAVGDFLAQLAESGFAGDIASGLAARTVHAADNSIYELRPDAVIFPRNIEDIALAVRLAGAVQGEPVALTARGGGTGTNGQSLNRGVVIDVSRHMNRILAIDLEAMIAEVEPGVVLEQLNARLADFGLFFPPDVSSGSRATIGGMVATDASGKGSRVYGKTSDYIERLDVVLADGSLCEVVAMSADALPDCWGGDGLAARALATVLDVVRGNRSLIERVFPRMNRGLTGYNLQAVEQPAGQVSLIPLLAGSEGTLAITGRIRLRLKRRPVCRALAVIRYVDFESALGHVRDLVRADPTAIEVLDDKVIALARDDAIWSSVEAVLGDCGSMAGLSFVEFTGMSQEEVDDGLKRLEGLLANGAASGVVDWESVIDEAAIRHLWKLRATAVGLLGRIAGRRQGVAFVEDCAVPPEHLPEFVAEFRALLDSHGLVYGMFGHADVGCLHVRPALDLADPRDAALIRTISDRVAALTRKYGGLLWGEHGKGVRGEFSPLFFGPELYPQLLRIKAAFDPKGMFNPGKLADPRGTYRIDEVPLRGHLDGLIDRERRAPFERAIACNGNGQCFNWDEADPMCPSYKVTRDRVQSPKGRAALLREWLRRTSTGEDLGEIEQALDSSLATCLSCKACANQCPVRVDIPAMKAAYLSQRHRARPRPLRDQIIAAMEALLPLGRAMPGISNAVIAFPPVQWLMERCGLVNLPAFSHDEARRRLGAFPRYSPAIVSRLGGDERERTVIVVEDGFTSSYDLQAVVGVCGLLEAFGYSPLRAGPFANGKALHVRGMLNAFTPVADAMRHRYGKLAASGLPLIGIEPVTNLMFAQEYRTEDFRAAALLSVEQFLAAQIRKGTVHHRQFTGTTPYRIFLHCTEKTARPATGGDWMLVFEALGLKAEIAASGCCGMAGLFGHEREHREMSHELFEMSWRAPLEKVAPGQGLVTGFSCRCQTRRFTGQRPRHPAEALLEHIQANQT